MLTVLLPENGHSGALRALLTPLLPAGSEFRDPDHGLEGLTGRRLLFAVALDEGGCNEAYYRMLSRLRRSLTLLRGQWHYASVYMDGIFMGCRSRLTPAGIEVEQPALPAALQARIQETAARLRAID